MKYDECEFILILLVGHISVWIIVWEKYSKNTPGFVVNMPAIACYEVELA